MARKLWAVAWRLALLALTAQSLMLSPPLSLIWIFSGYMIWRLQRL